jgi:hypothetical protein
MHLWIATAVAWSRAQFSSLKIGSSIETIGNRPPSDEKDSTRFAVFQHFVLLIGLITG